MIPALLTRMWSGPSQDDAKERTDVTLGEVERRDRYPRRGVFAHYLGCDAPTSRRVAHGQCDVRTSGRQGTRCLDADAR